MALHHAASRADRERGHFDQLADRQGDLWWGHTTRFGQERLAMRVRLLTAVLDRMRDPRCVELGCGIGTFTEPLLEARPELRVTGVDVSPRCVEMVSARLQRFRGARFQLGDAVALPFPAHSADVVFGNGVLHHVDLAETLAEVRRVLRPGGWIWFSEPNMLNPQVAVEKNVRVIGRWLQNSEDETAFVRFRLSRRLSREGFTDVDVRPYDFLHPGLPGVLLGPARAIGAMLDRTPLLREIAGSLEIVARTQVPV
jgi:SAM-dependent methyltransferase